MKRERRTIKSWIHLSTRIHFSKLIGAWIIEALQKDKTIGISKTGQTYRLVYED